MAIIGVGKYAYDSNLCPGDVDGLRWLEKIRSREKLGMRQCLSKYCKKAYIDNVRFLDCVYVWNDQVVFEMEPCHFDDIPSLRGRLWYLRRIYVVDVFRGRGVGRQFIDEIKKWCDLSGSIVCLCAVGFCIKSNALSYGCSCFDSADSVVRYWGNECVVESGLDLLLCKFYSDAGFENACVAESNCCGAGGNRLCVKRQFIYAGRDIPPELRFSLSGRLNAVCGCESCATTF
jgi:GNAT superfamily N-acetyltransferase